jgi:L-rhamnono-1,4-lactonase
MPIPIVDSHVHLFSEAHLPTLAWHGPENPLGAQYSVGEYRAAAESVPDSGNDSSSTYLCGFVYLEVDRISSLDEGESGWTHVLDEVSFLTRIALGEPISGEGHSEADRSLCLAIIPWAPVPAGPAILQRYMSLVRERTRTEEVWKKIRGVRYLVQDKPAGTMLTADFVNSLKWLGRQKLIFDLGLDARQGGLWQLREAVEMIQRTYDGVSKEDRVVFIISQFLALLSGNNSIPRNLT